MVSIEEVLAKIQKNKRVCPQPQKWRDLYEMLPEKRRRSAGWEQALPGILDAWWDTAALPKMLRLRRILNGQQLLAAAEFIGIIEVGEIRLGELFVSLD